MKENLYDLALAGIGEIIEEVSESISKEFKGANPFDKEPISNDEMLLQYNMLTPDKMNELIQTHGREAVNQMIMEMETLKGKRRK